MYEFRQGAAIVCIEHVKHPCCDLLGRVYSANDLGKGWMARAGVDDGEERKLALFKFLLNNN